jgi:hypothetical protein
MQGHGEAPAGLGRILLFAEDHLVEISLIESNLYRPRSRITFWECIFICDVSVGHLLADDRDVIELGYAKFAVAVSRPSNDAVPGGGIRRLPHLPMQR